MFLTPFSQARRQLCIHTSYSLSALEIFYSNLQSKCLLNSSSMQCTPLSLVQHKIFQYVFNKSFAIKTLCKVKVCSIFLICTFKTALLNCKVAIRGVSKIWISWERSVRISISPSFMLVHVHWQWEDHTVRDRMGTNWANIRQAAKLTLTNQHNWYAFSSTIYTNFTMWIFALMHLITIFCFWVMN